MNNRERRRRSYAAKCNNCHGAGRRLVRVGDKVAWVTCLGCGGSGEQE